MATPLHYQVPDVRRAILGCVGMLTPKGARQIALEVGTWLGEDRFGVRRLHRHINALMAEGKIVRVDNAYLLPRRRRAA